MGSDSTFQENFDQLKLFLSARPGWWRPLGSGCPGNRGQRQSSQKVNVLREAGLGTPKQRPAPLNRGHTLLLAILKGSDLSL